ncbi:hypothetical protein LEP1GSC133_1465 [Leptospira borgpetersenii serovar Pomona str. 200901868]|uniref:Uncharacterized protein n=1 Tax=Leptospira borgpetersenii serovar Pomona str. 200901868 TaxID=1192866 RepID=M6W7H5_LEPBO|nr:hypothetical protein LEP1GSC133_1465 [Leptospira borgpetersenii serovar Pomona str. 200901868]
MTSIKTSNEIAIIYGFKGKEMKAYFLNPVQNRLSKIIKLDNHFLKN